MASRADPARWVALVVADLGLGVAAIVPAWLVGYVLRNSVLARWGLADRNPTENEGIFPVLVLAVPVLVAFAAAWWVINARLCRDRGSEAWLVAVLMTALPTATLVSFL